jgi:hypothetical protein
LKTKIELQTDAQSKIFVKYGKPDGGMLALLSAVEDQHEQYKSWLRACSELEELEAPEEVAETEDTQEELRSRGRELERYLDLHDQLAAIKNLPKRDPSDKVAGLKEELDAIQPVLSKYADDRNKILIANERYTISKSRIEELKSKIEGLGNVLEEKRCFEMLVKAYSNNKLKLNAANSVLKALETELNALAPLVFPEPVKFELTTNKQGISAVAHFKAKKPADIYTLSGAESNCFRLLFALAILVFVPPERRPNFMILDEPESNCGDSVRKHMINEFLPKLLPLLRHPPLLLPSKLKKTPRLLKRPRRPLKQKPPRKPRPMKPRRRRKLTRLPRKRRKRLKRLRRKLRRLKRLLLPRCPSRTVSAVRNQTPKPAKSGAWPTVFPHPLVSRRQLPTCWPLAKRKV